MLHTTKYTKAFCLEKYRQHILNYKLLQRDFLFMWFSCKD